jgi:transcriptional regulator with PAS, ATPase and Fis domain
MNEFDTRTDHGTATTHLAAGNEWILTVAYHEDDSVIGERLVVPDGSSLVLGRSSSHFRPEVWLESKASREHLKVVRRGEALEVTDLQSRNGSYLNGRRIESATVQAGDVVAMGRVLLLAHRGPQLYQRPRHGRLVGLSAALATVVDRVSVAAPRDVTVLIQGETGVGKELVARAIHEMSGRAGRFMAINCSALADGVLQSELFGHTRGAYSGAGEAREGLVAAAREGTLFLDEIGDASTTLQAGLLRLLEQREYRAVGSDVVQKTNARFVAATNVDLHAAVEAGRFRADLLGRLDRWRIEVPPLRERPEDVIPIALHFTQQLGEPRPLGRSLAQALLRYNWPANVRELAGVIEQAVLEAKDASRLPLTDALATRLQARRPRPSQIPSERPSRRRGTPHERPSPEQLRAKLVEVGGNVRALANALGVGRSTLYRWLAAAGIDPDKLRSGE